MSRIDELIAEHCPNGVEFRRLGDVCTVFSGFAFKSSLFNDQGLGLPLIRIRDVNTGDSKTYFSGDYDERYVVENGDLLIGMDGDFRPIRWSRGTALLNQRVCRLQDFAEGVDQGFLYHLLKIVLRRIQAGTQQSTVRHLSTRQLQAARIPFPPAAIQREIASTLDQLEHLHADLEASLEVELAYRSRQYEFYRDRLMTLPEAEDVQWVRMGEAGQFFRGKRFTKADYVEDGIPAIHYGEIYTAFGTATDNVISHLRPDLGSSLRFASPGDVVLVDVGETVEDVGKAVAWLGSEDVAVHDHCYVFRHGMNPAFVSYYMQTARFHTEKAKHVARTKVKTLLMDGLAKVPIPVPPLEEQERIVGILNKFDALVNELSIGLPAEIRARRTQYEYYRDKLLTFEERVA